MISMLVGWERCKRQFVEKVTEKALVETAFSMTFTVLFTSQKVPPPVMQVAKQLPQNLQHVNMCCEC